MNLLAFVALSFAVVAGMFLLPDYYVMIFNYIGLYTLVALGVVLLTGVAGITSFGQAAFVGLSAYTTAVLSSTFGLSPWIGLVAGLALTLSAAAILGSVTLRLSGHYLPLGTLAWGLCMFYLFGNMHILGGHTGMSNIPALWIGSIEVAEAREFYILIWVVVIVAMVLAVNLLNSRTGRAMRAVKRTRDTAESFGIDTARTRLSIFLYAAALASISGWLYAHMLRFVNPSPFGLNMGIEYLFMAVVGGAGQVWGALLGASIITGLKEYLQDALPRVLGQAGNFEIMVFGALVVLLLQLNRERGFSALLRPLTPIARLSPSDTDRPTLRAREREMSPSQTLIEARGVSKSFGGLQALSDVSFSVQRGEIVSIIGPNGAGKSTLFNCLTGILQPNAGEVLINGARAAMLHPRSIIRAGVARTFQHVQLVHDMTALENAMLGAHIRGRSGSAEAALRLSGSEEAALRAEAGRQLQRVGLGDVVNTLAGSLSLGQQRLLEIARALCADPDLLLLDEPAAGLRYREKKELAALLQELRAGGMGVLLVEHDMEFVMRLSDRIVVVNFGQKIMEGSADDVIADPRVIEAYLGAHAP